jgi:hypothetical protein
LLAEIEWAKESSGLSVKLLRPEFAQRVTKAIRQVAEGVLNGTIRSGIHDQSYGNAETVAHYHEGLRQLLAAIPRESPED